MESDISQHLESLLTPTEAAKLKDMSLHLFKYHLRKPGSPTPVLVGRFRHQFFREADIVAWNPQHK